MADSADTVDSADMAEDTTDRTTDLTTAEDLAEGSADTAAAGKHPPATRFNPSTETRSGTSASTLTTIYSLVHSNINLFGISRNIVPPVSQMCRKYTGFPQSIFLL
jgi:hypothetical protein